MKITKHNVDYHKIYELTQSDVDGLFHNGIRDLYEKHVKEIESDILNGRAKFMAPVEININTGGVIDGNHRFKAACNAWEKGSNFKLEAIFRDISPEEEADIIVKKNTSQKSWGQKDFKHKLLVEGNKSAKRLNDFCLQHAMLHGKKKKDGTCVTKDRYAMALLRGQNVTKELISGTIEIIGDDVEFGEQLYNEAETLYKILGFQSTGTWFEYFLQGWYEFRSSNKFCKRLEKFGLDRYYEAMVDNFEREKVNSKAIYTQRFVSVLTELEKTRGGIAA